MPGGKDINEITGLSVETGKPVRLTINDGLISAIEEIENNGEIKNYVSPGFIDNQINGFANIDFSRNDLNPDEVAFATRCLWKEGVTTYFPTVLTNSHENLTAIFRTLSKAAEGEAGISIAGFHLEGPYISSEDGFRGCHPVEYIRKPSWKEFMSYQEAAGGMIMQVTLAPEVDGAIEFIRKCTSAGIVSAIGHSNAGSDQIKEAVDAGATLSTHLGNGCANLIHRHKNPIWPQLSDDRLTISVIADGHHLLPEELRVFYKVKGPEKMILTSDVIYLSGMAPGKYNFLGSEVVLTEDGMLFNPAQNCLAGASFPIRRGIGKIKEFTNCSLADAIKMASGNVASFYGLKGRGALLPGLRADVVSFQLRGSEINVMETWLAGRKVCY